MPSVALNSSGCVAAHRHSCQHNKPKISAFNAPKVLPGTAAVTCKNPIIHLSGTLPMHQSEISLGEQQTLEKHVCADGSSNHDGKFSARRSAQKCDRAHLPAK